MVLVITLVTVMLFLDEIEVMLIIKIANDTANAIETTVIVN
jgi:hypothetical protein